MSYIQKLKEKAKELKRNIVPVYFALFDRRTPLSAKMMAAVMVGYLLSPIDLIPDFIPVLGFLDDLILVPLLISVTVSLIPEEIINDIKTKISGDEKLQKRWYFAVPVILIYLLLLALVYHHFIR